MNKPACIHIPPFDEREERAKDGQIKVYCRKCGRFIGYRPESKTGSKK